MRLKNIHFLFLNLIFFNHSYCLHFEIDVSGEVLATLNHFWKSTGFCPPFHGKNDNDVSNFILSNDMKQNLLLLSSTPHKGIEQVRIHWLLDMVSWSFEKGYNFIKLDEIVDIFYQNNLAFGFEIMGSPSNHLKDFDNEHDILELQRLLKAIVLRYEEKFGNEFIKKWKFETWNEPDHKNYDNVTMTVTGFLRYFKAISTTLKLLSKDLVFGGPGGSCRKPSFSKRCWALLDYCSNVTLEKCGLDYLSIHKKGNSTSEKILENEIQTLNTIFDKYPNLSNVPIVNDEADPLVGWNKSYQWRADVRYATMIAKSIIEHQNYYVVKNQRKIKYELLSNDNAFLNFYPNFFTQRTLNTRFQINNTAHNHSHFIKKPALSVMGMLSKLGKTQISSRQRNSFKRNLASIISVRGDHCNNFEVSSLFVNSANAENKTFKDYLTVRYNIKFILKNNIGHARCLDNAVFMTCYLNNYLTNPYIEWLKMGSPVFPNITQFEVLHKSEEMKCTNPKKLKLDSEGFFELKSKILLPQILLHQICWYFDKIIFGPSSLQIFTITKNQILLKWKDDLIKTRCIKSYQVEFSQKQYFKKINKYPILFNSYYHLNALRGSYRVKFIDMFDRSSPYSQIKLY